MTQLMLMVIAVLVHIGSFFVRMSDKRTELMWRYVLQVMSVVVFLSNLMWLLMSF